MRRFALIIVFVLGCDDPQPSPPAIETSAPPALATTWTGPTGDITGRVTWTGPPIPPTLVETYRPAPGARADRVSRAAPNLPFIDQSTHGVAGAIIVLRGVTVSARFWDHPPVHIELHEGAPMIRQGDSAPRSTGTAQRGGEIAIVSRQNVHHALRARGAAFWTFTLPDADKPLSRRLDQDGIVELSSAAGYYWMHAYLLVSDHPYCANTDSAGRFAIPRVPSGDYELAAWMPSWHVVRRERDPESTAVTRIVFGPHHEWRQRVTVRDGETTAVGFTAPR